MTGSVSWAPMTKQVLAWIDDGPDLEDWLARQDEPPSPGEIAERADYWRYERLHPLHAHLTGDWQARYQQLRDRFGPLTDPEITGAVRVGFGQTPARFTVADLRAMTVDALLEAFSNYQPRRDVFPPESEDSLAMVVSAAVAEDPGYWVPVLAGVADRLPVRHLQAALDGCWQAARDGTLTGWEAAITLCETALDRQPAAPPADLDDLADWRRTVDAVVRVVERAARAAEHLLATPLRLRCWHCCSGSLLTPTRTPDADASRVDEPFHAALNGIRSRAIEAVIAFAQTSHPDAPSIGTPAMVHMPEIRQLLDDHLDVDKDRVAVGPCDLRRAARASVLPRRGLDRRPARRDLRPGTAGSSDSGVARLPAGWIPGAARSWNTS